MFDEIISKDSLKPGDVVGIRIATRIGWSHFRYTRIIPMKIKRITPARTKFVMENGCEYNKHDSFYLITDKLKHESYIAECAMKIRDYMYRLEELRKDGKLFNCDDTSIEKMSQLFKKIVAIAEGKQ